MNIIVIGSGGFNEHLRILFEKEWHRDEDLIVYIDKERTHNEKNAMTPCYYDLAIVEFPGNNGKNSKWRRMISGALELNPNMIVVCIFSCDFIDVSMFELMDLSRIMIIKCPRHDRDYAELVSVLEAEIEAKVRSHVPVFCVKNKKIQKYIPCTMIIYAAKVRSGLKFVTVKGEFIYGKKMDEFEKEVENTGFFCRCHSSYLVNFRYVSKIQSDNIYFRNGESVPISRNYRNRVRSFVSGEVSAEEKRE